jgi:hypothetical protein
MPVFLRDPDVVKYMMSLSSVFWVEAIPHKMPVFLRDPDVVKYMMSLSSVFWVEASSRVFSVITYRPGIECRSVLLVGLVLIKQNL